MNSIKLTSYLPFHCADLFLNQNPLENIPTTLSLVKGKID